MITKWDIENMSGYEGLRNEAGVIFAPGMFADSDAVYEMLNDMSIRIETIKTELDNYYLGLGHSSTVDDEILALRGALIKLLRWGDL